MAIIESLLDMDLYKLTTGQMFFNLALKMDAVYKFKCRSGENLTTLITRIREEIAHLGTLRFTKEDLVYIESLGHFNPCYVYYLRNFQFHPETEIGVDNINGVLDISIIKGTTLLSASLYEIFVLAIVQELYGEEIDTMLDGIDFDVARSKTIEKCAKIVDAGIAVVEFGTRRRHSHAWQDEVIGIMSQTGALKGTSNMYFAKKYNLPCIGTMPHEYLQFFQAAPGVRLRDFQMTALREWHIQYGNNDSLRTALTDVVGMDSFLKDLETSKEMDYYTGFRHDSGDPFVWVDKLIAFYESNGFYHGYIQNLLAVFSDGLDVELSIKLADYCKGRIKCSFGIGTNLSNDCFYKPLQIVMKMVECDGLPVAKISDSRGKGMCQSPIHEAYLKEIFGIPNA